MKVARSHLLSEYIVRPPDVIVLRYGSLTSFSLKRFSRIVEALVDIVLSDAT